MPPGVDLEKTICAAKPCPLYKYKKNPPPEPDLYFNKLFTFKRLQDADYPLKADDLSFEEWMDLADLKDELNLYMQEKIKKET